MKSPITKKIESFRKKIERGIEWAKANDLVVTNGCWFEDGAVCPIGARLAKDKGSNYVEKLDAVNNVFKQVARHFGVKAREVEAFVNGVDDGNSYDFTKPNEAAFYKLGRRLSDKYAL